jgi:hypothetical protein
MKLDAARELVDRFDTLCQVYRSQHPDIPHKRGGRGKATVMSLAAHHLAKEMLTKENVVLDDRHVYQRVRWLHQNVWFARRLIERADNPPRAIPKPTTARAVTKQPLQPRFSDYGIPLSEAWIRDVNRVVRALKSAAKMATQAGGLIRDIKARNMPARNTHMTSLANKCTELAFQIRAAVPASLCPYCKGIDAAQSECMMCASLGYLTLGQDYGIPRALKDTTNRAVMIGRDIVPISDAMPKPVYEVKDV